MQKSQTAFENTDDGISYCIRRLKSCLHCCETVEVSLMRQQSVRETELCTITELIGTLGKLLDKNTLINPSECAFAVSKNGFTNRMYKFEQKMTYSVCRGSTAEEKEYCSALTLMIRMRENLTVN